jgi:hypothetical protein
MALHNSNHVFSVSESALEFPYPGGKVDLIAGGVGGELLAFEAKLSRWRHALHQAYRASTFAHYSFVLVPAGIGDYALRRRGEFEKRGVGLCVLDGTNIRVAIPAQRNEILQPWLTLQAQKHLTRSADAD